MACGQTESLVEPLANRAHRAVAHDRELRAHIHAGHEAVGRRAVLVHALIGEAKPASPTFRVPAKIGPLTGVPGQICTSPLAISCEPTHWLNWPMESTSPPCLCRKAGVQGSSKAWSFTHNLRPRRRKKSPMRKSAERRLAPMGSSR